MRSKLLILFCLAAILAIGHSEVKVSDDQQRARLPEFLTELDLASLEASEEDIDSLKKVVKRLAPAKNGEYLMYQVFFGNEELLKEWIKGAGVMGQPGVDFPVLTAIPATKFSCRGLKGGYYADLETNCQVFHICDNGRKISFLCPNGTIFQQSQLICDWWFKVDCGKSSELYEQSAEQLAEEDRKRADAKKMNSEFHRTTGGKNGGQVYYQNQNQNQNQNVDYDGKQNGRSNPFGQNIAIQNTAEQKEEKNVASNVQQNGRNGNQFNNQGESINPGQNNRGNTQYNNHNNFNNNYNSRTKESQNSQDYFGTSSNLNSPPRDEKTNYRNPKAFGGETRNNFNELTSTADPFKEYQQPAESAAFATSRNNRYNKSFQYNQFGNYYSANQLSSTEKYQNEVRNSFSSSNNGINQNENTNKKDSVPNNLPFATFAPIYKPRTTTTTTAIPTTPAPFYSVITTQKSYVNTDVYRHNTATQNSNYANSQTVTDNIYTTPSLRYDNDYRKNTETQENYEQEIRYTSTQKPYVNTDTYRQSGAAGVTSFTETPTIFNSLDQTVTTPAYFDKENRNLVTSNTVRNTVTEVTPSAIDFQNFGSTQKPWNNDFQANPVTSRNLSPYDTSFTYKNGKIASTLGPYVPFTKNYAFTTTTTTTTGKPPVYTATVPTIPDQRRRGTGMPTMETPAYFQTTTTPVKGIQESEREHAIEMLQSLQDLEATAPTDDFRNGSRIGLNIPPSSGPSTLHTLALYFATASDNFDSNETTTDTAVRINNVEEKREEEETASTTENAASAELPTSILTQNTINSYADLFNINSAVQSVDNSTVVTKIGGEDEDDYSSKNNEDEDEDDNDLDIQQSQGPVSGDNQRNNPKLRELAQVFTHALSAYLHDPDAFRKVLTEIRPTEPPTTYFTTETTESTTIYPTTNDDYPSATKEKDEVLDFSDVTKASRKKKLTTPYPTTGQTFTVTPELSTYQTYYTTETPNFIDEALNEAQSSDFRSSDDLNGNNFAQEVNQAFRNSNFNDINSFNIDPSGPSAPNQFDSYVPIGATSSGNRFGGFQNNSAITREPYGRDVKPSDATPIGNNYVPESTPASYVQSEDHRSSDEFLKGFNDFGNTATPSNDIVSSTQEPFRINYYEGTTYQPPRYSNNEESLVTAGSVYSTYGNSYNDLWTNKKSTNPGTREVEITTDYSATVTSATQKDDNSATLYDQQSSTNHWTASPTVTRLWETTVFLDPKHINQGLSASGLETTDVFSTESQSLATTPISTRETLVTDASAIGETNRYKDEAITPAWKWSSNENDSPTAFTLLPTIYTNENTATPAPTYTTHSSIITTITSSVSSSAKPASNRQEKSYRPLRINVSAFNVTENEIVRAQEMFGGLNASSSNTLMKVMKQADNNSTVRQLVLLLISHCKGPMNKTLEEEKEQLLDALLRMPVNEFSSDESRDIIDGINNLQLPIGRDAAEDSVPTTTTVSVTTYRNRKGRKFRTSMKSSTSSRSRSGDSDASENANSLSIEAGSPSDNRALELLRSLYTIAAKWG